MSDISQQIGKWTASEDKLFPELRKENRIRTIQASLAVEQNTLSLEQVTALINGKTVLGSPKEIQEVHNAFSAYENLDRWSEVDGDHLLEAHGYMMRGLILDAGQWRNGGAGIYRGDKLVHMAPPANQVPRLMIQLLGWLRDTDAHPLIASAAFHYEFEFIHPFSDGNGRMGRFWQTLILSKWNSMLSYLPVETVIKAKQNEYYSALREADSKCDCTAFIEFLLSSMNEALNEAIQVGAKMRVEKPLKTTEMRVETQVEMRVEKPLKTTDQILLMLEEDPTLTLSELSARIGRVKSTVERAVGKLKKEGRLEFRGPKKGGRWVVLSQRK
ncbi:Fic family protein [Maribrevibacterium harenarium]|uniref:Fic family protein n=1 Tax=Maribrevibacterium harenarium TaxID=2589817 RepID=UPI001F3E7282|nr:Fic family protein [Maribrevibacterium harenarium]